MDIGLIDQTDLLTEGFQHVWRLALCLGLFGDHLPLARHDRRIDAARIERLRIGLRDVHRRQASQGGELVGFAGGFQCDNHADLARRVVHIAGDHAFADGKSDRAP
jgi:hypothetical protein